MGAVSDPAGGSGSGGGDSDDSALSTVTRPILRGLLVVRGSFLLFVAVVGVLFVLAGVTVLDGTLAGMFGIWGVSCVLYAALGYGLLKFIGYH